MVVQERLGHASATITMATYSHGTATLQREAIAGFDSVPRSDSGSPGEGQVGTS